MIENIDIYFILFFLSRYIQYVKGLIIDLISWSCKSEFPLIKWWDPAGAGVILLMETPGESHTTTTYWGPDKMAAILQTTFLKFVFLNKNHCILI